MNKAKLMWQIIGRPVEWLFETLEEFTHNDQFYLRIMFLWYIAVLGAVLVGGYHATATLSESVPGFWNGLWHGLIAWPTLILSTFVDSISVYATPNNGPWYNWGFIAGISLSATLPFQRRKMQRAHKERKRQG